MSFVSHKDLIDPEFLLEHTVQEYSTGKLITVSEFAGRYRIDVTRKSGDPIAKYEYLTKDQTLQILKANFSRLYWG